MRQVIRELKKLQDKRIKLVNEFMVSKKSELLTNRFKSFLILKDDHLIRNDGFIVPFVRTIEQKKSYIRLHGISMAMLLDTEGIKKELYTHKKRGLKP